MLKADIKRTEGLASTDDAVRMASAAAFARLKPRHFLSHPVGRYQPAPELVQALLAAWSATASPAVRMWIAQMLAMTGADTPEVFPVVLDSLSLDGEYLPARFAFVMQRRTRLPGKGKDTIRAYYRHRHADVRYMCADALFSMQFGQELDYAEDIGMLRELMLDTNGTARLYAVQAAGKFGERLGTADFETLLDVVNVDSGAARQYAKDIIARMDGVVPGCTVAAFAPRVPCLRHDGVYRTGRSELDAAGRWVSSGCLRFFPDGTVHAFGTDVAPADFQALLPLETLEVARGLVHTEGGRVRLDFGAEAGGLACEGEIDGDKLSLVRRDPATGAETRDNYVYWSVDWAYRPPVESSDAADPAATPARKPRAKRAAAPARPFVAPKPRTMTESEAAKWYLQMVGRLPGMLDGAASAADRLALAWQLKQDMRAVACKAQYDPKLEAEFLARLPLPGLQQLLASAAVGSGPGEGAAEEAALRMLLAVTPAEVRAFPGTVGEAIDMQIDCNGQTFVMTEAGWAPREATQAGPAAQAPQP